MTTDQRVPVEVTYARALIAHVQRTVAVALGLFALVGGAAGAMAATSGYGPGWALISLLTWGTLAAAGALWLRRLPF